MKEPQRQVLLHSRLSRFRLSAHLGGKRIDGREIHFFAIIVFVENLVFAHTGPAVPDGNPQTANTRLSNQARLEEAVATRTFDVRLWG